VKYTRYILLFGCVAVATTLYFMPRKSQVVAVSEEAVAEMSDLDRAVLLIENGENPMQGITILKELEMEDESNMEVVWLLAKYSLMSGQIEKALPRLQKLTEQAEDEFPEAVLLYARSLVGGEEEEKAEILLEKLIETSSDTVIVNNAQELLKKLHSTN